VNDGKSYTKRMNNLYVLKPPFTVGLQANNFFFNTDILDYDTKDTLSITFYNCDLLYDSKKFYSGVAKYEGAVKNVILDLNKGTKENTGSNNNQGILELMSGGNIHESFTTYKGILDQSLPYTKLCIKGRNQKPTGGSSTAEVRIDLSKFKYKSELKSSGKLPNSLEDIKRFINGISNWYNKAMVTNPTTKRPVNLNTMYKIPQVR
jgi:hypothetical protein